ncbi:uncharacterized protein LOC129597272 [Paramacrobiotus metropolitanus]|uniref:uncharacterized protein LOC129597272 n=1 Tax=Paramacrobiotus metropolitanus TaxID=2943436 RepID=UPI002445FDA3|nr:uncharacterized protein LOC129597272 [Paramacrobiotus metropolitanus]
MESVTASMPPFRRLLSGAGQMSYQNTVAVKEKDEIWLGFIQDINGGQAFIDFDSKKEKARWINASVVYLMPWFDTNHQRDKPVFAALRDEDDGPFRFQSVFIKYSFAACNRCVMYYVETNIQSGDSTNPRIELVDYRQILGPEWFTEPPLLYRNSGLLCTKYFVPSATTNQILSKPTDRSRIIKHFREAFESDPVQATILRRDCCRFHLRIEAKGCVFVVISTEANADTKEKTIIKLSTILERHLVTRANLMPICFWKCPTNETHICMADSRMELFCSEALLGYLPHWIFSEIFSYLDLHSQLKFQRVCALWHELLRSPHTTEHVRICLDCMTKASTSDNYNCSQVAALLTRTINSTTKSLTIVTESLSEYEFFPVFLLMGMELVLEVHVPLVVLKDYILGSYKAIKSVCCAFHLEHPLVSDVVSLQHRCERIILHNWKISHLFGRPMYEIFAQKRFMYLRPLPHREKNLMLPLGWDHVLAIDQLEITVERVVLDCDLDQANMVSRIMSAVNETFPIVTDEMHAKVKAIYARWVRNLVYPTEWETIRSYLSLFSGFYSDGTFRSWVGVDLRVVDPGDLSKMALYGINEIFLVDQ